MLVSEIKVALANEALSQFSFTWTSRDETAVKLEELFLKKDS